MKDTTRLVLTVALVWFGLVAGFSMVLPPDGIVLLAVIVFGLPVAFGVTRLLASVTA